MGWIIGGCLLACGLLVASVVRLRHQLRASREAFTVLSQRAPMGIMRADANGFCIYANEAWCELSGLSLAETLGHSWSQAVHPDDLPQVMAKWDESVRLQQPYVNEARLLRPDGSHRRVLAGACPIRDEQGLVTGFVGTVLDVTRLDQASRELAEREHLLRALIDVQENEKQLLCHEFHDGLIQYAVGSKMLLEGLREGSLPKGCRSAVDTVIECLAKGIEDGRRVIRGIRPAALDDLGLRAALDELADDLQESGIDVETNFAAGIDDMPPALQTTVYRLVQESLNNVRKHSGSGRVELAAVLGDDLLEVTIVDFGRGFDPDATTGRGFGLAGVRERARLAGGRCSVDTGIGKGTRIAILLPVEERRQEAGSAGTGSALRVTPG
ncbi:MAG: PAS domain-containing protein [Planctomycetota bacterium]